MSRLHPCACPYLFSQVSGEEDPYGDINYIRPFREGNGRRQVQYLEQLVQDAGHSLDLARIPATHWIEASISAIPPTTVPWRLPSRRPSRPPK